MKLITKANILGLIIIVSICTFEAVEASSFLKVGNKNGGCSFINNEGDKPTKLDVSKDVFPGDTQIKETKAKLNAEVQTKAARNLFYNPSNSVLTVLKNVAKTYKTLFQDIKMETESNPFKSLFENVERQTGIDGAWQAYNLFSDVKISKSQFHQDVVQRIGRGTDFFSNDILGFLGLLGDLGASLQDTINRPVPLGQQSQNENKTKNKIKTVLDQFFGGGKLDIKSKQFYDKYSPDNYYDIINQQSKKNERKVCRDEHGKAILDRRAGVLNVGNEVDKSIMVVLTKEKVGKKDDKSKEVNASDLKKEMKLPDIGWPWQTVPKKLIDFCPNEPWAGHFSGSLYELILMLEIFDAPYPIGINYKPTPTKKKIYAAIAASFLIATGMHSAVEIVYVIKKYIGDVNLTPDQILKPIICHDATYYVAKLIKEVNP